MINDSQSHINKSVVPAEYMDIWNKRHDEIKNRKKKKQQQKEEPSLIMQWLKNGFLYK